MRRALSLAEENAYAAILRRCCETKNVTEGKRIHSELCNAGYDRQRFLGNLLVQMYGSCSSLQDASLVFDKMQQRNNFSWNIMIGAYAQNGHLQEARRLFNLAPVRDVIAWTSMMTANVHGGDLQGAKSIFDSMPTRNRLSWGIMIQAFAERGHLCDAEMVFSRMPLRDVVSSTSMLVGRAQDGNLHEATKLFDSAALPGCNPVTCIAMVNAFARSGDLDRAKAVFDRMPQHDLVAGTVMTKALAEGGELQQARDLLTQMPQKDLVSYTAMITSYADNRDLDSARDLFNRMPGWNAISWTAMVTAFTQNGHLNEARELFRKMPVQDVICCNAMVAALGSEGLVEEVKQVFEETALKDAGSWKSLVCAYGSNQMLKEAESVFQRMPERDTIPWNVMVAAYGDNQQLHKAIAVFQQMPDRNLASWSSMVMAYARNGRAKEALGHFRFMDLEGFKPDKIAWVAVLDVCATYTELAQGKLLHAAILEETSREELIEAGVSSAIVNMYGKCGCMEEARRVFAQMALRDLVGWTSIIAAHSQVGKIPESLELLQLMLLDGVSPNQITFITILGGCSHAGLLKTGRRIFITMQEDHYVNPGFEHYRCMIDLLGRLGHLKLAEDLVENMPFVPEIVDWRILLAACTMHGDIRRGTRAAGSARSSGPEGEVLLHPLVSNMYTYNAGAEDHGELEVSSTSTRNRLEELVSSHFQESCEPYTR